jgi:sensor histidine kinase YesM
MFPFIENAFKYSRGSDNAAQIAVIINANGRQLNMEVTNNKSQQAIHEHGGIGQANSRKRLELLYPGKHQLQITNSPDLYAVKLTIELD